MDVPAANPPEPTPITYLPFCNVSLKTESGATSIGLSPKGSNQGLAGAIFNQALRMGLIDFQELEKFP
eukprot:3649766-Rhodomonas_salina.1